MSYTSKVVGYLNKIGPVGRIIKLGDLLQTLRTDADGTQAAGNGVPVFSVGTETTNTIAVTFTLADLAGNALAAAKEFTWWISDTALAAPTATAPDLSCAQTTGVALKVDTTKVLGRGLTNAAGVAVVTVGEDTAKSFYVNIAVGGKVASQIITFV